MKKIVLIVGDSPSGKTFTACRYVESSKLSSVVYDVNNEMAYAKWTKVSPKKVKKAFRIAEKSNVRVSLDSTTFDNKQILSTALELFESSIKNNYNLILESCEIYMHSNPRFLLHFENAIQKMKHINNEGSIILIFNNLIKVPLWYIDYADVIIVHKARSLENLFKIGIGVPGLEQQVGVASFLVDSINKRDGTTFASCWIDTRTNKIQGQFNNHAFDNACIEYIKHFKLAEALEHFGLNDYRPG